MIADSGCPDGRRRRRHGHRGARRGRGARGGAAAEYPAGSIEGDLLARLVIPRSSWSAARCSRASGPTTTCAPTRARAVPPLQDPEKLAVLLYTSGTSGRPRAAMLTHRALLANIEQVAPVDPPMIHGDDVVLGVLPLFHVYGLNAVLGVVLRHRAKLVLDRPVRPAGHPRPDRGRGVQRGAGRAAGLRLLARRRRARGAARPGAADAVRLGAAVAGAGAGVQRAHRHPGPPGLRPDRGRRRSSPARCAARSTSPARSAPRCPASRSGWSTRPAGRPRARTRARSRSGAPTCSAATGPTAPTAPTPTAGGRPATSASSTRRRPVPGRPAQGAGDRLRASTSTRSRSRTSSARSPASPRSR